MHLFVVVVVTLSCANNEEMEALLNKKSCNSFFLNRKYAVFQFVSPQNGQNHTKISKNDQKYPKHSCKCYKSTNINKITKLSLKKLKLTENFKIRPYWTKMSKFCLKFASLSCRCLSEKFSALFFANYSKWSFGAQNTCYSFFCKRGGAIG